MNSNKTLIGKNNYLFLQNDTSDEINCHCISTIKLNSINLPNYNFNNYLLIIYPNKSFMLQKYLPDGYNLLHRPGYDKYKKHLDNNILDGYEILKNNDNTYYKTDTHINLNGNYMIYKAFINKINLLFNLSIDIRRILINKIKVNSLNLLNKALGDLTWDSNLGDQKLLDITDDYYYTNNFDDFYCYYKINTNSSIRFLLFDNDKLNDNTELIENLIVDWNIISKYIIYNKNICENKLKVIIFYDSFLLSILSLYITIFHEIYLIKNTYSEKLIDIIKPDYVFEFRVERFLR